MAESQILGKEAILAAKDTGAEFLQRICVPEWGGDVLLRRLSGAERDRWEQRFLRQPGARKFDGNPFDNIRASMAALVLCDERGEPMFNELETGQLGHKSAAALQRVWDAACQMNGLTRSDVEELRKNSSAAQTDASPSA